MKVQVLSSSVSISKTLILCGLLAVMTVIYMLAPPPAGATLASFTVNSTADTVDASPGNGVCADALGNCTLRAAIMEANASAGADTINLPAGTYTLTLGPFDDEFNFDGAREDIGDLDVLNDDLTINGAGAASTIIDGGGIDRIFDVSNFSAFGPAVSLTLNGLTLRNGHAPTTSDGFDEAGGAIQFDASNGPATLTLTNCILSNNTAAAVGGAVASLFGEMTVSGSQFSGNHSTNASGGGIFFEGGAASGFRTLQVNGSSFTNNTANSGPFGNGGAIYSGGSANVTVENNTFNGNHAGNDGGAVFLDAFLASNVKSLSKNKFETNSAKRGGAVFNQRGMFDFKLNLVVGNSASTDAASTGLRTDSIVNVANNWWGCNTGPTAGPCDRSAGSFGSGGGPWLVLRHAATPSTVTTNTSSSLQADFFTPSSGAPVPAADLVALNGRPIVFNNAVGGTISGADTQISGGKANATYNAGATGGNGSADATVDHATATASIIVVAQPAVTTNPLDQTVCANGSASFTASSSGFPTPTVQWQVSTDGGVNFNNISGATSTTLTFTATAAANGNLYRAVFTNSAGSATSTAAALTVNTAPSVTTNPGDATVCEGAGVSFSAAANGSPAPTVQWQVSTGGPFTNIPGETSTTLSFTTAAGQNGNRYRAVFTNACSSATTTAATLNLNAPTSATTPVDQTVCQGAPANFATTASGTGPFTYQWSLDANPISGATSSSVSVATGSLSGGNHTVAVLVGGSCGSVTRSATLTVNTAPVITTNPVSQTVVSGNVTFTAAASGSPAPTVQWQVSTNSGASFNNISGATSTSLTFATNPSQNGYQYRAVFTNACGSATSTAATLTTCTPPAVTGNPASVVDACVGAVINFSASASGFPTPAVQWQVSTNGGVSFTNIPGATSTTLSVSASVAVRNNQYRAVFTNDCGTDTSAAATLGVDTVPPVITLSANTITLWPPNHSYQTVNVTDLVTSATDNCTANLLGSVVISSASSDEPENGNADGNTLNDIVIAADCRSLQLRAERDGNRNGRVYRINLKVTDSAGNVTTATAKVFVPRTQNGSAAIDDGPGAGYTVTGNCP